MTGKYKNRNNWLTIGSAGITFLVMFFGSIYFNGDKFISVILMFAVSWLVVVLIGRCSFNADDDKIIIREGPIKYEYRYSEIESAEAKTGFTHNKYGISAYIELVITLTNGETKTFCGSKSPDNVLSTPEKHKEFYDNHQFTKLSNYINGRVGESDSSI